jgi:putative endopeptidase
VKRLMLCGAALVAGLAQAVEGKDNATQLRALIEAVQQETPRKAGSEQQKIGDFYASYMDVQRVERLGYKPLISELQRIRVLRDRRGLPQAIAHLDQIGVPMPYALELVADPADSTRTIARIKPGQLGMADRAAYLPTGDAALQALRVRYGQHIEKVLALGGARAPAASAQAALALETRLAQLQPAGTSKTENDEAGRAVAIDQLNAMAPGYDWASALGAAGVSAKASRLVVSDAAYLMGVAQLAAELELDSWKAYLEWQLLHSYAAYLSKDFTDAHADFYGKLPLGMPDHRPRWEVGVTLTGNALGDLVGKHYVARYFPPERKAALERVVAKQFPSCRVKLGYPGKWRDTSSLFVSPLELIGNVMRLRQLDHARLVARLGGPVDLEEWQLFPHSAGISFDAARKELELPAALFQPPRFTAQLDDKADDGAIATMITEAMASAIKDPVVSAHILHSCAGTGPMPSGKLSAATPVQ